MQPSEPNPRSPSLKEVIEGAKRASERVKRWPKWMKDISGIPCTSLREIVLNIKGK